MLEPVLVCVVVQNVEAFSNLGSHSILGSSCWEETFRGIEIRDAGEGDVVMRSGFLQQWPTDFIDEKPIVARN